VEGARHQVFVTRRDDEEKFVIVAAMQRELRGIGFTGAASSRDLNSGNLGCQQTGADTAGSAETRQIAREAVREIHHGTSNASGREPLAKGQARFGVEMFSHRRKLWISPGFALLQKPEAPLGFAKAAADIDQVAGMSAGASESAAFSDFTDNGHIDKDLVAASRVAARQNAVEFARGTAQAGQKTVQPAARKRSRHSKAQQAATRHATHGGDVAHRPSQALPANGIGRMFFAKKVRAFEKPVAGQDGLLPGPWPKKRGIITNPHRDLPCRWFMQAPGGDSSDPLDQGQFVLRLGSHLLQFTNAVGILSQFPHRAQIVGKRPGNRPGPQSPEPPGRRDRAQVGMACP